MDKLQEIFADVLGEQSSDQQKLPPVDKWDPPLMGDMDLIILRNGTWLHEGSEFGRHSIIELLAKVLKREGDDYFLVTPVEKWRIRVEDVPFCVSELEVVDRQGVTALCFKTTTGDNVVAGAGNPLRIETDTSNGEPSPYILVRGNLEGRINRSVFYELVEIALAQSSEDSNELFISSLGEKFCLGSVV